MPWLKGWLEQRLEHGGAFFVDHRPIAPNNFGGWQSSQGELWNAEKDSGWRNAPPAPERKLPPGEAPIRSFRILHQEPGLKGRLCQLQTGDRSAIHGDRYTRRYSRLPGLGIPQFQRFFCRRPESGIGEWPGGRIGDDMPAALCRTKSLPPLGAGKKITAATSLVLLAKDFVTHSLQITRISASFVPCPWPKSRRDLATFICFRLLKEQLAFRGGTALHKLFLKPATRYSEDIDLVQLNAGAIGPVMDGVHEALDAWLGAPRREQKEGNVTLT